MVFISKYHIGTRWRINLIKSQLDLTKKDRVLDAGCGEGYIAHSISKKVKTVQAVDFSKEVIKFNKSFETAKLKFDYLDLNNLDKDATYLIIDDVSTTGTTFNEIIRAINEASNNKAILNTFSLVQTLWNRDYTSDKQNYNSKFYKQLTA